MRQHGGRQEHGWQFDFRHLYRKSGSAARFSDFTDVRALVARQSLPATSSASSGCRTTTPSC
ncbi:replication initiator protein A [Enterobacter cloacae complex sp. 288G10]|uniref:replication initiator protein A n=1 Tax=Enterobacter cloacae complex sp. 288G10 TaxID=3395859 RepID=UPI003CF6C0DA